MKLSRLLLQIVQGGLALNALLAGVGVLREGAGQPPEAMVLAPNQNFDSMLRFVGGIWLGIGLVLFWGIHRIEHKGPALRAAWAIVLCGGLGRMLSLAQYGFSGPNFLITAFVEVLAPPLLALWQYSLAARPR